jgi:hypothetical protein
MNNAPIPLLDPAAGPRRPTPTPTVDQLWAAWARWMREQGYESRICAARRLPQQGGRAR